MPISDKVWIALVSKYSEKTVVISQGLTFPGCPALVLRLWTEGLPLRKRMKDLASFDDCCLAPWLVADNLVLESAIINYLRLGLQIYLISGFSETRPSHPISSCSVFLPDYQMTRRKRSSASRDRLQRPDCPKWLVSAAGWSISPAFALSTPDQEISWNIRWKVHKHDRGLLWSKLFSAVSSALPGPEKLNGTRNCPTTRLRNPNPKIGPSRDNTTEGQANPHAYNCAGIPRILLHRRIKIPPPLH
ncbi:hypothetical protein TWF173_010892 [Orbilia oligospora]|nr:hypothetical protein TWF173_010892 [Orbilia oligospora]